MSSVRLCDDCNGIFSENAEDWSSAPVAINRRDKDGQIKPIQVQQDYCPECTDRKTGGALRGNNQDTPRVPPVRGRYDERYTKQLEREAGIGGSATEPGN